MVNESTEVERIDDSTLDTMRNQLGKLLKDKRCGSLIKSLLKNMPQTVESGPSVSQKFNGSLLDLFDSVRNGRGFWLRDGPPVGLNNNNLISFERQRFSTSTSETNLDTLSVPFLSLDPKSAPIRISKGLSTALNLVHELTHGFYQPPAPGRVPLMASHESMADAARLALVESGIAKQPVPFGEGMKPAQYVSDALLLACKDVKL